MKHYSTYLFDVGGTLIGFDRARWAEKYAAYAAQAGVQVSPAEMQNVLEPLDLEIPERSRRLALSLLPAEQQRAFWLDFMMEGFRRVGVDEDHARRFVQELLDSTNGGDFQKVYEDVVPTLEALQVRGRRLGIISNFSPNCEALLNQLGIGHYFDFFIVSGILGIEKPDPRIFQAAVQAAGRDVSELVYVGDSVFHDVEGARKAGMDAVLIDRADRFPEQPCRVRDLRELARMAV